MGEITASHLKSIISIVPRLSGRYLALGFLFMALRLSAAGLEANSRDEVPLDFGWKFHLGDIPGAILGEQITGWRWKADDRGESDAAEMAAPGLTTGNDWQDARPGDDTFQGRIGFAWYHTTIPGAPGKAVVHFQYVDDNAVVYLNGKLLGRHQGWNDSFDLAAGSAWHSNGENDLAVLVENTDGPGGIGPARVEGVTTALKLATTNPINPAYDDSGWRQIDVPHDYVVEGTFDRRSQADHGFLPVEPAWYRKTIQIPAAAQGRRLWLEFDGVFSNSTYWLNGRPIGRERSGYSSFRFDITGAARPGENNVLVVRTDPVFEGWWYEGGGIYRHVRLVTVNPVHVAPWGVYADARVADPANGVNADATVVVKTTLANDSSSPVVASVLSEVLDADGHVEGRARGEQRLEPNATADALERNIPLTQATLWSLENPYLYRLRTTVSVAGTPVDQSTVNFGVRQLRFDPDHGFFLNGKPVKFQGVCCHQDHAGVGIAIPDRLQVWRLEQLKKMGCNAYRTSHNAPSPVLLDACDRLGILVMDENRHLGDTYLPKTPSGTTATELVDLSAQIQRDRNHPCVIMWSMCNEEDLQGTPEGGALAEAMRQRIDLLDGSRPVTSAMIGGYGNAGGITFSEDIQGINYNPGDYQSFHQRFPKMPLFASETASEVGTRGIYATETWEDGRYTGDKAKGYVSAWGTNAPSWGDTAQNAWRPQAEHEFVMGGFAWTGFDYKGEPTPFDWPCINSHFGIMDICGFPKDSFYYYQSWWTDKPVLHVFPHWNWAGKEGQEINVWVYSNCDNVELFLNGQSLGKKTMERNQHLEWKVNYVPGVLSAKGYYRGKLVTAEVQTTGDPFRIVLEPDRSKLSADGTDLSVVTVKIVDSSGRVVPTAGNLVRFSVTGSGRILGVGNGDPSCHEPDKASRRSAFNGLCQVLLQTTRTPGEISLQAESQGLKTAAVVLDAE
ncbi:MAG: beta-galactosidase GalA [Chthoniobacteraceae bacterium]